MRSLASKLLLAGLAPWLLLFLLDPGAARAQAKPKLPIPRGSKLAQVKPKMTETEVEAILGRPTSTNSYLTAKAWNPFDWGPDSGERIEAHYKRLGVILYHGQTYSPDAKVEDVRYDPKEPGYPVKAGDNKDAKARKDVKAAKDVKNVKAGKDVNSKAKKK